MPQNSLKQYVPFWFRTGLLLLAMLGVVFAGLNGPIRHAFLFRVYEFLGMAARSDDKDWVKGATVDERFFVNLRHNEELRKIKFKDCNLTTGGLRRLSQFFDLLFVEFDNCRLEENCLGAIKNMRNLFQISITDCSLTDQHLQNLHGSRIPVSLTLIEEDEITTGGILALRQANPSWRIALPERQPVDLTTVRNHNLLNVIPSTDEISNIEELVFSGTHVSGVAMSIVKDALNLKYLSLVKGSFTDDGLKSLQGLENLERLHLSSENVLGPGLRFIPNNIKELEWFTEMDVAWNDLDRLVELETLYIVEAHVSEADLRAIHELNRLTSLTITSKNSQWDGLQHLPMSIKHLGVFYGVSNDAVKQLGRLNELETLCVGGELISDDVCNDLANMKALQGFELHNTAITEAGLNVLAKAFGTQPKRTRTHNVINLQKE